MLPNLSGLSFPNGVPTEGKRKRDKGTFATDPLADKRKRDEGMLADAVAMHFTIKAYAALRDHLDMTNQLGSGWIHAALETFQNKAENKFENAEGNEKFESLYEGDDEEDPAEFDYPFRGLVDNFTSTTIALIVRRELIFWKIEAGERYDDTGIGEIYTRMNAIGKELGACVVRLYQKERNQPKIQSLRDAGSQIVKAGFGNIPSILDDRFTDYQQYLTDLVEIVYGPM